MEIVKSVEKVGNSNTRKRQLIYLRAFERLIQPINSLYETKTERHSKNKIDQMFALFDEMNNYDLVKAAVHAEDKGICHSLFSIIVLQYLFELIDRKKYFDLQDHQR